MGSDGIPCAPIASHSIPLCTQQFPCLQVPRAVGGHGMAWSLPGRVWEPMGVYGSSWEQSWEQCFLRVDVMLVVMSACCPCRSLAAEVKQSIYNLMQSHKAWVQPQICWLLANMSHLHLGTPQSRLCP